MIAMKNIMKSKVTLLASLISLVATVLLSACAGPASRININDPQAIASKVSVQRDDFMKIVNYIGPNVAEENASRLLIRVWKNEQSPSTSYQIYVSHAFFNEWRFYDSAYDSNGERLDTSKIDTNASMCDRYGCMYTETVGLNVTRGYLEKNKGTGIKFKVSGRKGEAVFSLSGAYIQGFLSVVDGKPTQ
jgi:hypothetical protein